MAPGRLADGRYAPGYIQYRIKSDKLAVILDDPAGGLPWVLRQFDADRVVVNAPARSLAKARRIGQSRCVQLGRLRGATVGWIYGDGQFREAGTEYPLLQCTALKRQTAVGQLVSTLAVADPAAPAITGSVVWGYLPGAKDATVSGAGSADGAAKVNARRVPAPGRRRRAAGRRRACAAAGRRCGSARAGCRPRSPGASRSRR